MSNGFLYIVTVLIWGSTWFAIEFQLGVVPAEVSVFYRYAIAAGLLLSWCLLGGLRLRYGARAHVHFMGLGLLLFGLNYVLTYHAQVHITSALSAIAFSTMLWMNIVNARVFFGVAAGARVIVGSAFGVVGIGVLFWPQVGEMSLTDQTLIGAGLSVCGAFVASLGNMVSQSAQRDGLPVIQANAFGMLYGALFTGTVAALEGRPFTFDWSLGYVVSLGYLAVFGSIVAFGTYLTLLGRIGAHKAGYAMVMFPVVALALSVLFEGLELTLGVGVGLVLVLTGNVIVLNRRAHKRAGDGADVHRPTPVLCQRDAVVASPPCQEMKRQSEPTRTSTSV